MFSDHATTHLLFTWKYSLMLLEQIRALEKKNCTHPFSTYIYTFIHIYLQLHKRLHIYWIFVLYGYTSLSIFLHSLPYLCTPIILHLRIVSTRWHFVPVSSHIYSRIPIHKLNIHMYICACVHEYIFLFFAECEVEEWRIYFQ